LRSLPLTVAAVLASALVAAAPSAWSESRESFDLAVPMPPSPVAIDGREWLIYELHLTNFSRDALQLQSVDVLRGETILRSFAGGELAQRSSILAASRGDFLAVQPGERAIIYLEVPSSTSSAPRAIRHRVRYVSGPAAAEVAGAEVIVRARERAALGPPLRGGPWAAVYAWEWPRGHRRVFYTLAGRARLPGRFAIDWVRQDERGLTARGDADVVINSLGYGADVLAVADARVAVVRDGIAESERVSANPDHPLDDAAGNYVALDLGDGRFAIYEHLKPGSIRVARGDRVRRGQVLASLGFTGDSTGPHLHFHVADHPSPLSGEGLPYEFDSFRISEDGRSRTRERERPAPNAVVVFD
jgi:murein DD-endopeptidase